MIIVPFVSARKPQEAGGSEVMVKVNGCVLTMYDVIEDELAVVAAGVSMVDRATSEDSDGGWRSVESSRIMVLILVLVLALALVAVMSLVLSLSLVVSAMIVYSVLAVVGVVLVLVEVELVEVEVEVGVEVVEATTAAVVVDDVRILFVVLVLTDLKNE